MSHQLMRTPVAATLLLLSVLLVSGGTPAQEKKKEEVKKAEPEKLADAFKSASWQMDIDLLARKEKEKTDPNPGVHDRPGIAGLKLEGRKLTATYQYKTAWAGFRNGTLEGETDKKGKKITAKFVEKGLLGNSGDAEFEVVRDEQGRVIRLEGTWTAPGKPKLKWHIYRVPADDLKAPVKKVFESSKWVSKMEVPIEAFRKAAKRAGPKSVQEGEDYIKKFASGGWVPYHKDGTVEFKTKDGQFLLSETLPDMREVTFLVTHLKPGGQKVSFKASGNIEPTEWNLHFVVDSDGKVVAITGTLHNSALDMQITLTPKAEEKKK